MAAKRVAEEIRRQQLDLDRIIIGLPVHLNGTESERSTEVRTFAQALGQIVSVEIQLFDERLTTVQAERLLRDASMRRKRRTPVVDGVSSTLLLQSFLDRQGHTLP